MASGCRTSKRLFSAPGWRPEISGRPSPRFFQYRRWINDRSRANGETLVSCLARDEEEARQLLTGKFADHISTPHRHYTSLDCATQAMAAWLAADRPVTYCSHEHPPDITPMAELLKPYGKPAPEPEATTEHAEEPAAIAA